MRIKTRQLARMGALVAVAMAAALPSRADLIAKDSSYGVGTIIEDTATGLDWLKLTVTQNRSFNDISSNFGAGEEFAGFRYASTREVSQLFYDGGLTSIDPTLPDQTNTYVGFSQKASDLAAVTNLISLFGSTYSDTVFSAEAVGFNGDQLFGLPQEVDYSTLAIQTGSGCSAAPCAVAFPYGGGVLDPGIALSYAGSYLVESAPAAVPESGSAGLLGTVLLLLALRLSPLVKKINARVHRFRPAFPMSA